MARPAMKSVKFLSYNSIGMNSVKTQWVRDLMDTCGASYCGVQDHFKKIHPLQKYFKSEFPKCDSLVQLSLKSLKGVRREQVPTSGWRIQAQILHFGGWRLLWINVYFPNDPRIVNFDEAELLVVQTQLEAVLERVGNDGCLCGGDWNYDGRRTSGFAKFWYSVWLSAGRPAPGELHRLMVSTKTKFRYAVRRARRKENSAKQGA